MIYEFTIKKYFKKHLTNKVRWVMFRLDVNVYMQNKLNFNKKTIFVMLLKTFRIKNVMIKKESKWYQQ